MKGLEVSFVHGLKLVPFPTYIHMLPPSPPTVAHMGTSQVSLVHPTRRWCKRSGHLVSDAGALGSSFFHFIPALAKWEQVLFPNSPLTQATCLQQTSIHLSPGVGDMVTDTAEGHFA
ncbi:hypothetical protein PIB30_020665 [Stylosanthes scabra]|uniref:Uncharacterized protein n=1 Tax=Stylosanthes scabra TaxID=79078 RepID=A0ABU6V813_9FABA|nr:hypothetical protein [Stylosanthes scabra]